MMAGPWEDYGPVASPTPLPADGPWADYGGATPQGPLNTADYKAQLHAILAAPDFTPDKAHAFIQANHRIETGTSAAAFDWIAHHPGHGGEVSIQDIGAQQPRQPQQAQQQQTMAVAPEGMFASAVRGGVNGYIPFADKLAAGIDTVVPTQGGESIWGGHSLTDAYQHNSAFESGLSNADASAHPVAYYGANVGGALLSPIAKVGEGVAAANGMTGLARAATTGILGGGAYGAAQGAGQPADSWSQLGQNTLGGAAAGVLAGGVMAPVAEGAVRGVAGTVGAARRVLGADEAAGAKLVALKLAQDHIDPQMAAGLLQSGVDNGTQTVMADLGPNTRALAGSVSRQPGAARDVATNFTYDRQIAQGERVHNAINRDLGPTTDTYEESNRLIAAARARAAPLYDKAYANPAITTPTLERVLATPAAKAAVGRASTIAANEFRDPKALGFVIGKDGNVVLDPNSMRLGEAADGSLTASQAPLRERGYSPQTLDYVKRGLDDIIENAPRAPNGKPIMDEYLRSVDNVRRTLLGEVDRLNPDYAAARQAYAGPAALKSAMQEGEKALTKSPAAINQRLNNMSDAERQHYALGFRSALSDAVSRKGDTADRVKALIGTPAKRTALQRVFGQDSDVSRFIDTLGQESQGQATYNAVHGNSATASRLAEDANNSDLRVLGAVGQVGNALAGGKAGLLKLGLTGAQNAFTFGVGKAGQRAREDAASMLFTTNPNDFLTALEKAQAARQASDLGINSLARGSRLVGGSFGGKIGGAANALAVQHQTP